MLVIAALMIKAVLIVALLVVAPFIILSWAMIAGIMARIVGWLYKASAPMVVGAARCALRSWSGAVHAFVQMNRAVWLSR